ncbi:hypothetical protein GQ457_05G007100 [Hibiscus cannabinus]
MDQRERAERSIALPESPIWMVESTARDERSGLQPIKPDGQLESAINKIKKLVNYVQKRLYMKINQSG